MNKKNKEINEIEQITEDNYIIDKHEHYNLLYGFYENLLTEKQKEYFMNFYFYDLSLSEIAKNFNVSRSAVFDAIEKIHKALDEYEKMLGLLQKYNKREELYTQIEELEKNEEVISLIKKLRDIEN